MRKPATLLMRKQRRRSAARFATYLTIDLLPKSEILSLKPSAVVVQPSLCRTWSETEDGFSRIGARMVLGTYRSVTIIEELRICRFRN